MNSLQLSFAVLAVVLVLGVQYGDAIKCHICNSGENYDDDKCDPLESDKFLFDCTEYGLENNIPEYINATMCRKIAQTIQGDYRVVRSCAKEGRTDRCVERTGTKAVKVTYCECNDEDGCNSASALSLPVFSLLLSAALALFMRS